MYNPSNRFSMPTYLYPTDLPQTLNSIKQDDCFSIISFSFQCSRSLNDLGLPYGPTLPSTLEFTCKAGTAERIKPFYEQVIMTAPGTYNFFFDPTFKEMSKDSSKDSSTDGIKYLDSYIDAMTVRGNLIDLVDVYTTKENDEANQMLVTVKLLITEIVFIGDTASKNQRILKIY